MIDEFSSVSFKDERMNDYLQFELEKAKKEEIAKAPKKEAPGKEPKAKEGKVK